MPKQLLMVGGIQIVCIVAPENRILKGNGLLRFLVAESADHDLQFSVNKIDQLKFSDSFKSS